MRVSVEQRYEQSSKKLKSLLLSVTHELAVKEHSKRMLARGEIHEDSVEFSMNVESREKELLKFQPLLTWFVEAAGEN